MQDSGAGMPWWVLILLVFLAALFIIAVICICQTLKKNKRLRDQQENAIMRELQMAKSEGLEIPAGFEKHLARLEDFDEENEDCKKRSGRKNVKVHPDGEHEKGGRRKFTRYAAEANSGHKLVPQTSSLNITGAPTDIHSFVSDKP